MSLWLEHLRGGRIQYHDAGGIVTRSIEAGEDGPPVVMLHGTWGHAEAYVRNVRPIAAAGYRTYAIDMIGHGFTARPDGCSYEMSDYVTHLFGFLDSIGAESAHIVGESLGGWVAMHAALSEPRRVTSVINVVGGGLRPTPPTDQERLGWETLEDRSRSIIDAPTFENWRKRMEWLVHDPTSMTDELVHVRAEINATEANREASAKLYGVVAKMLREQIPGALSAEEIGRVTAPLLYVWTDHNPTTPASVAKAAYELTPDAEFHLMLNCAHWPQHENPDEFNSVLTQFLDAH